jgi:hypothetical protein
MTAGMCPKPAADQLWILGSISDLALHAKETPLRVGQHKQYLMGVNVAGQSPLTSCQCIHLCRKLANTLCRSAWELPQQGKGTVSIHGGGLHFGATARRCRRSAVQTGV